MKYLWAGLLPLLILSLGAGAGRYGYQDLWCFLSGGEISDTAKMVFLDLRLPRILAAFLAGGMLAASGCAAQNLFRNDLASPHVLGVVNAAALGAVFGLFLGGVFVAPLSIIFGIVSLFLLFLPGKKRGWDGATLILAGIAVNAFASALTSGALYLAGERLSSVVFWLLGGFWRITWSDIALLAPTAAVGWFVLWRLSPEMDVLLLGDRAAQLSGVPLHIVKPLLMLIIGSMTAVVVSCSGVIGFVGLVIPHIARSFTGAGFRRLLPCTILSGGSLLVIADLFARTSAAPQEIPVGILTALAGGPFFFFLLLRKGSGNND